MSEVRVSVIVVSYQSAALLVRCLAPMRDSVVAGVAEVIVVDNGSTDDPTASLAQLDFNTVFIETGANVGFSRAVNIGYRESSGRFILLLNPDVQFAHETLQELLQRAENDHRVGIIAPLLRTPGVKTANGGRLPRSGAIAAHSLGLAWLIRKINPMVGHYMYPTEGMKSVDVEWVSGGMMLIRREALLFDQALAERWFMYAEDVDLCLFVTQGGRRVVLAVDLVADHDIGSSDTTPNQEARTIWVSALRDLHDEVFCRSLLDKLLWRTSFATGFALRAVVSMFRGNRSKQRKNFRYSRAALCVFEKDVHLISSSVAPLSRAHRL